MSEQQFSWIQRSAELESSRTKVNATEIKIVSCSHVVLKIQIQVNFNNCKRHCTSPVKLYTNTFATDVSVIVSVSFWASLFNSTLITTNTFSQNLGRYGIHIESHPLDQFLQARLQHLGDLYPLYL